MTGWMLWPLACSPPAPTLRRVVDTAPASSRMPSVSVSRSRRNTSATPLVSSATRLVASDENTTKRPSALIDGSRLAPLASAPVVDTLTRVTWALAGTASAASRQATGTTRIIVTPRETPGTGPQFVTQERNDNQQKRTAELLAQPS